ncbi:GNAT family N-acetyltransferase [Aestuariirhabdus sp. LZHN29]|uniref:GNAT family N-acetyltransferase n=1 Tax=Aestuariirhabdus sp. LZHN29 TaxID=3417462 RepID=UPI003CF42FEF
MPVKIESYSGPVDEGLWHLLLLADPKRSAIEGYLPNAALLVAYAQHRKVGVAVLTCNGEEYELKNIAVIADQQRKGIARQLIAAIKARAKSLGANSISVGTGNSSLGQLALYQKTGFRISGVRTDFFASYSPPIYENGIRCRDLVILTATL